MPLKHDNLSNEGLKLNGPKRLDINHARVLNISLGVRLNINPVVLFGTAGKPRLFPNNINPWYNRQDGLFFPDQEESHAIFANLIDKKRYKRVPSMREKTKHFSRRSQATGTSK